MLLLPLALAFSFTPDICPAGKHIRRGPLNTRCKYCDSGQYQDQPDQQSCKACPSGTDISSDRTYCKCIESNQYLTSAGVCATCPSGMEEDYMDGTRCRCPYGKYITDAANWSAGCTACPSGMDTDDDDPTRCKCPYGEYMTDAANWSAGCTPCPTGMEHDSDYTRCICKPESGGFVNATNWLAGCAPCPAGTKPPYWDTYEYRPDAGTCYACAIGQYGEGNNECNDCPSGKYQDETGQATCKTCAAGLMSARYRSTCIPCWHPWQYHDGSECTDCPIGQIVYPGDTECSGCAFGTYLKEDVGPLTTGMCIGFPNDDSCDELCLDVFDYGICKDPDGESRVLGPGGIRLSTGPYGCIWYAATNRLFKITNDHGDADYFENPPPAQCSPEFQCLCTSYCAAWSTCPAGQGMASEGSGTSDRTCVACPSGKYSAVDDGSACATIRAPCSATEYESTSPTASANRVCTPLTTCIGV